MKKALIIIIICLIGLGAGWFAGKYFYNHTEKPEQQNSNEEKPEKVKLSLEDEKIEFLSQVTLETFYFEHVSTENDEQFIEESLFTDKKVNVASLSANFKMSMALSTINYGDTTTTIPKADMVKAYKKIFGTDDVADSFESLIGGGHGKLTLNGDNYKWDRLDWGSDGFFGKRLPYEAYQYEDRIEIDYIFAENNMHEALGNDDYKTVEYYAKDGKTVVFSYPFANMDFDDDQAVIDNQSKFKHYIGTYVKGTDDEYHIVSVEPR